MPEPTPGVRELLIATLLTSWVTGPDPMSQAIARVNAERNVDTILAALAADHGDLGERLAEALTREHYRRARERIEASPEEHSGAFARVALAVCDEHTAHLAVRLAQAKSRAEAAEAAAIETRERADRWCLALNAARECVDALKTTLDELTAVAGEAAGAWEAERNTAATP